MDNFEKFVRENREAFDAASPDPRVWDRLEKAVTGGKQARLIRIRRTWLKAAGFLLLAGSSAFLLLARFDNGTAASALPADLQQVQAYYSGRIETKLQVIARYPTGLSGLSPEDLQSFQSKDSIYHQLREALRENPGNVRVKAAFIQYYRSRLRVLDKITAELTDTPSL